MGLKSKILGRVFQDNCLYVVLDSGCGQTRFLFDCGMSCLDFLGRKDIQKIDHLCFSHFHFDHIGGFDHFLRFNFHRGPVPVQLFGPPGAIDILQHRLQGFVWNLVEDSPGIMSVSEISENSCKKSDFYVREGYKVRHNQNETGQAGVIRENDEFSLEVYFLDHIIPSVAYKLTHKAHPLVDAKAVEAMGLTKGPWLKDLKNPKVPDHAEFILDGRRYTAGTLRSTILRLSPKESLAYLTDFRLAPDQLQPLAHWLRGTDQLYCESHFLGRDSQMAWNKGHMTAAASATLAAEAKVGRLELFHLSERYREAELPVFLEEAKTIFPNTHIAGYEQ